jgi:hypothetical protein
VRNSGRLRITLRSLAAVAAALCSIGAFAAESTSGTPAADPTAVHYVGRATSEINVDGVLDDAAWSDALSLELNYEIRPGENIEPPARTVCLITYDDRNMYFGFRAYDPDPSQIRARYSDRDKAWNDDWVGVVLDTFNDQRRAYEMVSTPLGVQNDAINDDVSHRYDDSWNAIWDSAGRITDQGYEVEMAIPFNQVRFQSANGEAQTWGFDAIRKYPRSDRHLIGLFPRDRGNNSYLSQADKLVGMAGVSPGKNLELIPTLTASRTDSRDSLPAGDLDRGGVDSDLGLTVRWGITPNVSLNAAVNPDFSQVEADALRLDINEQFTLFFPEARPFFLEGADYFNSLLRTVHTRTVSDPIGALKLTGKQGRHMFGLFSAEDQITNVIFPGAEGSSGDTFDLETTSTVGRYRLDFGRNSAAGLTFTDRRGGGYSNTVANADTTLRFTEADSLILNIAASQTQYSDDMIKYANTEFGSGYAGAERFDDHATILEYRHTERDWWLFFTHQDLGEGFRADLGFEPQVDYRDWRVASARVWWGEEGDFYRRFAWGGATGRRERQNDDLIREYVETWINLQGPRQSMLGISIQGRNQGYNGVEFDDQFYSHLWFEIQAAPDLWVAFHGDYADWIDYTHTQPAIFTLIQPSVRYNAGRHVYLQYNHSYRALDVEHGRLFSVHAPELRVVHQFNNRSFVRAILQYTDIKRNTTLYEDEVDARTKDLFTQLLFSYKVNPQTAVYVGYTDGYAGTEEYGLTQQDRTIFVKLSYAWVR